MERQYQRLFHSKKLHEIRDKAVKMLENCKICPRNCGVNRLKNEKGYCHTGRNAKVAARHPHFGEEPPLVGRMGSGTIFFSSCNLKCIFCQNYEISHYNIGTEVTSKDLSSMMLELQSMGCHNINFVTPTHVVPQILEALTEAVPAGLHLPLVYNCGGYEKADFLRILNGVFDIYMPDFKFWDEKYAKKYCDAEDYPEKAREAIKEMHRQVGDLALDKHMAQKGIIVRHLVMPENVSGTKNILNFIAKEISPSTYLNLMNQYRPCYKAYNDEIINRKITRHEFIQAYEQAKEAGLTRIYK